MSSDCQKIGAYQHDFVHDRAVEVIISAFEALSVLVRFAVGVVVVTALFGLVIAACWNWLDFHTVVGLPALALKPIAAIALAIGFLLSL